MIFDDIQHLKPYFFSLREIEGTVSLDMKFPLNWKYDYLDNTSVDILPQDENKLFRLVSFISPSTKEGYVDVIQTVRNVIKINLEQEEKERLFQEKVNQLKELFKNESLDKLKEINLLTDERQEDNPGS